MQILTEWIGQDKISRVKVLVDRFSIGRPPDDDVEIWFKSDILKKKRQHPYSKSRRRILKCKLTLWFMAYSISSKIFETSLGSLLISSLL